MAAGKEEEVGHDYQARTGQDRTGQAGSQPENALLQCRLPPDAITANEETSCRPPFLFYFFLSHTHIDTDTYTKLSPVCVCVARILRHILWLSTIHHKMSRMMKS